MAEATATLIPLLAQSPDESLGAPFGFKKQQEIHVEMPESEHGSSSRSAVSSLNTGFDNDTGGGTVPLAICGIATRLPGGINNSAQLWDFLINKGDACTRIPVNRYTNTTHGIQGNISQAAQDLPGDASAGAAGDAGPGGKSEGQKCDNDKPNWQTHGYTLNHLDLAAFDASMFSMKRSELGIVDPQQRLLLELTR